MMIMCVLTEMLATRHQTVQVKSVYYEGRFLQKRRLIIFYYMQFFKIL